VTPARRGLAALILAFAWATVAAASEPVPLVLPAGESAAAWEAAAAGFGLAVSEDEPEAGDYVRIVVGDPWVVRAVVAGAVREESVAPPLSQRDREDIVLLASTLLQPPPVPNPDVPVAPVVAEPEPPATAAEQDGEEEEEREGAAGAWLGAALRADLRAGRREATSLSLQGGVEFGPGFRAGIDIEGVTSARFDGQDDDGPVHGTWSLGVSGGVWWGLRRPVTPLIGAQIGVQVRSFVADLGVDARVPVPAAALELAASIAAGSVLRIEPHVRLTVDLRPTDVDLGDGEPIRFTPLAVQFGVALRAVSGRSPRK